MAEERKWEEMNQDCLIEVFKKVGGASNRITNLGHPLCLQILIYGSPHNCNLCLEFKIKKNVSCLDIGGMVEQDRKWENMNQDCLIEEFKKVGMEAIESLIMDVPFLCKDLWKEYHIKNFSVIGFIKLVISRSQGSVIDLELPRCSTLKDLNYVSDECTKLQFLELPEYLIFRQGHRIPKLICKFMQLRGLYLGATHFLEEILAQVNLHCKKFDFLSIGGTVGHEEALAIVTHLPVIKRLQLTGILLHRESLKIIIDGCKQLDALDVGERICF
uniref:Uncharacterized protein n=1 Tax=Nelumbo nucifera TaxID=4432 RepID=A0A822XMI7_NELNU|nr:TPA_asm: hypothetical protein HUJ06_022715 [Nelumbo nucifera]